MQKERQRFKKAYIRLRKRQQYNLKVIAMTLYWAGFTVLNGQNVKDMEGNVYPVIKIGSQVWMAENLKTTIYNNGDSIGTTSPSTLDITIENDPKYQWVYNDNENNLETYGRLYTWYAATDKRNICPTGWHVPSDAEWTTLTDYLTNNGYGYKDGKNEISKSMASTSGWTTNIIEGNAGNDEMTNNSSGFSAFPGGYRYGIGSFNGLGSYSYWWSSTEVNSTTAWYRNLSEQRNDAYRDNTNKQNGISVRCLKDH
jgi:uncharacterized protein (TIGR02145 family)